MATDLNAKMWQMFVTNLTSQGGMQADPKSFLPTNGLALADWEVMDSTGLRPGDPNAKKGDINVANLEAWADRMPQWQQTYVPGDSLFNNYVAFLNAIKLTGGDPAQQQIADGLAINLKKARDQLATDQTNMFAAWTTFSTGQAAIPEASRTSYNDWYTNNWESTISTDQKNVEAANTTWMARLQMVGGPDYATLSSALAKTNLQAASGNGIKDPATSILRPYYKISPGLNKWFVQALVGADKPPQVDFTIDLSQAESHDYKESSYLNTSASGGWFFWGGSGSYSQSESASDFTGLASHMKMNYKAQALTQFTVEPGTWYDTAMVKGFYNKISPNSAFADKPLFGPGGLLNLMSAQIYVAFKRSITLTGEAGMMSEFRHSYEEHSHASFSIGGFFWSGSASVDQGSQNSRADMAWSEDGNSVTITDNTDAPKVIGVVPQNLKPV